MGNTIGYYHENGYKRYFHPDIQPDPDTEPTYDPNYGFEHGRKRRIMRATKEEMVSSKIPLDKRDYCAHLLLKFKGCRRDVWPWVVRCEHEKHEYLNCEYEDYVLRLKEYERERRLRIRQKAVGPPEVEQEPC